MKCLSYIIVIMICLVAGNEAAFAQSDRISVRMGNKYYRQQNFDKAEVEYRKALGKNPRNTQAMYNLGCALLQQQKDSAAIVQLENAGKAETSTKRKAMAYHNIGVICQSHQMYGEAIQAYQESLRNNPDDNETRYNLALCKHLQKKQNDNKNNGGGNDKNDDKKEENQKDNENNKDNSKQQKQTPKDQMSKENAEQLLNAAVQDEKATQQRMKKAMQEPRRRQLQKNW